MYKAENASDKLIYSRLFFVFLYSLCLSGYMHVCNDNETKTLTAQNNVTNRY